MAKANCSYKLVSYTKEKIRHYGIASHPEEKIPTQVLKLDGLMGISGESKAEVLFSRETSAKICNLVAAYAVKPGNYAEHLVRLEKSDILPPLPQPRNIIAVGLNYLDHNQEVDVHDNIVFPKQVPLTSAYAGIERPDGALLDWEVELGVVIRKEIQNAEQISDDTIQDYIAGFVLLNDVTNRIPIILDTEKGYTQGKTFKTFLPAGPYFIPIEAFATTAGNPGLDMRLFVNGELKQSSNTKFMVNSLRTLIAKILAERKTIWVDAYGKSVPLLNTVNLMPGDLLSTGTPGGTAIVAPKFVKKISLGVKALTHLENPRQIFIREEYCSGKYLRDSDVVSAEIEALGRQENRVLENYAQEIPVACDHAREVARYLRR